MKNRNDFKIAMLKEGVTVDSISKDLEVGRNWTYLVLYGKGKSLKVENYLEKIFKVPITTIQRAWCAK